MLRSIGQCCAVEVFDGNHLIHQFLVDTLLQLDLASREEDFESAAVLPDVLLGSAPIAVVGADVARYFIPAGMWIHYYVTDEAAELSHVSHKQLVAEILLLRPHQVDNVQVGLQHFRKLIVFLRK